MKLPWDKGYLKISFHVIFTLVVVYLLATVIDIIAFIISDLRSIANNISLFIGSVLSLFSPLIAAWIVAYLLDPVVDFYQNKYEKYKDDLLVPLLQKPETDISKNRRQRKRQEQGKEKVKKEEGSFQRRFEGAVMTYITVLISVIIIINILLRNLDVDTGDFIDIVNQTVFSVNMIINNLEHRIEQLTFLDFLLDFFLEYIDIILVWFEGLLVSMGNRAITIATSAWNILLNSLISAVVAFYFMTNKARLKYQIRGLADTFLPKRVNRVITITLEDLHAVFSEYIRGLILDGLILGTLVGIGLTIIGVDLAILIGVLTAIFNLIPFFGGIVAFFLSVTFELVMGSPINALYAAIVIIIIQQIDTIFIVPRIVGKKVHLSPPAVMLSLSIAGNLFGIVGMLLIVPTCATIKIFVGRFIARYREKAKKNDMVEIKRQESD